MQVLLIVVSMIIVLMLVATLFPIIKLRNIKPIVDYNSFKENSYNYY